MPADEVEGLHPKRVSRHVRPAGLVPEEWQTALRRQYGTGQPFGIQRAGGPRAPFDHLVTNPASKRSYRVAIRGEEPGTGFCSCPDFATNLLGTCKHLEFALARLRGRGGTRRLRAFRRAYSSVSVVYGAWRRVRLRLADNAPVELRRRASRLFDRDGWLWPSGFSRLSSFLRAASRFGHELRVYEDAERFVADVNAARNRRKAIDRAFPDAARSGAFEGLLKTQLPLYQREGALFACRVGRAVLADEMGLGKTVQAIAAAEIAARCLGVERVLVICPASLKHQWGDEIGRFSTRSVQVVGGLRHSRERTYASPTFFKVAGYDTLHTDLALIEGFSPELVILDEAQRIKNWETRAARSVRRIASPMALVLTGTPLENRLEELMAIVQFVDQHRLGPVWKLRHEHQVLEEDTSRVVGYRGLDRIGQTLAPILLRRRKAEVLSQLPERSVKRLFVPLTAEQRAIHSENRETVSRLVARWHRQKFLSEADQRLLTIALQAMRMACDDAALVSPRTRSGRKVDEIAALLADLLETEGVKVVVFSQWMKMHELLLARIAGAGWGHVLLHGGVPSSERGKLVRRFRDDASCRVFFSTDASGVGLNLQAASVVVNVDLPWNPAVLEQRIGRVHRIGQRRNVQVFDFVAEGAIEEEILSLLAFKSSLFAGVLDEGTPEVHLEGSRLGRLMKAVEALTRNASAEGPAPRIQAREEPALPAEPIPSRAAPAGETSPRLLRAGAEALARLASSLEAAASGSPDPDGRHSPNAAAPGHGTATIEGVLGLPPHEAEAVLTALRVLVRLLPPETASR